MAASNPTLFDTLAALPDPRGRHGLIHPLPAVLGRVAVGLLLGRTSLAGVARLGRQYGVSLAHALGSRRGKTPSTSALSRTRRKFDPDHLEAALGRWARGRIDLDAIEHLSIDGKTPRGSRDGQRPGQHLLAAYAPAVRAVLAQVRVDATTNEHKAALRLLGMLPVAGKVVIGDAIFCQRDLAERVVGAGGEYVLTAKDNQPGLEADVKAGFGFEAAARSLAAAASPYTPAAAAAGADGDHG